METIQLYDFQIAFIKEVLEEYITSKKSDVDTRLIASDIIVFINEQIPETGNEIW